MKYTIYTDASYSIQKTGVGAVLYNEKGPIDSVVATVKTTGNNRIKNVTAAEAKASFLGLRLLRERAVSGDIVYIYVDNECVVNMMAHNKEVPAAIRRVVKQLRAEKEKLENLGVDVRFLKEMRANNKTADALAFLGARQSTRHII